jgi:hypothetical protein
MGAKHKQRVLGHRVRRKIFGSRMDEVTRDWRKIHDDELRGLYFSPNIIWVI